MEGIDRNLSDVHGICAFDVHGQYISGSDWPFVYCVLENFVFSILMVERFRLMTAFSPSSLDPRAISAASFFTGPMVLLLVTALIWLVCTKGKRQFVLEV